MGLGSHSKRVGKALEGLSGAEGHHLTLRTSEEWLQGGQVGGGTC